jgi:hypothetical protein
MKAIVYHNYGSPDVLKCEEVEKPAAGDNEVLIKVRAASDNQQIRNCPDAASGLLADAFIEFGSSGKVFAPRTTGSA